MRFEVFLNKYWYFVKYKDIKRKIGDDGMSDVNISNNAEKNIEQLEVGQKVKIDKLFNDNNEYVVVDKKAHPSACAIDYTLVLPQYASDYKNNRDSFDEDKSRLIFDNKIVGYVNITGDAYYGGEKVDGDITRV